jgi:hypothetical protein
MGCRQLPEQSFRRPASSQGQRQRVSPESPELEEGDIL